MKSDQLKAINMQLKETAVGMGARFFGVADLTEATDAVTKQGGDYLAAFPRSISLGISLNYGIVEPTYVAAFDSILIVNANVPDDVVYKVTKALYGGKKQLFSYFKTFGALFSPKRMAKILVAGEYHPGAIEFYKEMGMWPPKE